MECVHVCDDIVIGFGKTIGQPSAIVKEKTVYRSTIRAGATNRRTEELQKCNHRFLDREKIERRVRQTRMKVVNERLQSGICFTKRFRRMRSHGRTSNEIRLATATWSERQSKRKCFNHRKRDRATGSLPARERFRSSLHHLVRPNSNLPPSLNLFYRANRARAPTSPPIALRQ